jgi:hypothetical protein
MFVSRSPLTSKISLVIDSFIPGRHIQECIDVISILNSRPAIIQFDKGVGYNVFCEVASLDVFQDGHEQQREIPVIQNLKGAPVTSSEAVKQKSWFRKFVQVHGQKVQRTVNTIPV